MEKRHSYIANGGLEDISPDECNAIPIKKLSHLWYGRAELAISELRRL